MLQDDWTGTDSFTMNVGAFGILIGSSPGEEHSLDGLLWRPCFHGRAGDGVVLSTAGKSFECAGAPPYKVSDFDTDISPLPTVRPPGVSLRRPVRGASADWEHLASWRRSEKVKAACQEAYRSSLSFPKLVLIGAYDEIALPIAAAASLLHHLRAMLNPTRWGMQGAPVFLGPASLLGRLGKVLDEKTKGPSADSLIEASLSACESRRMVDGSRPATVSAGQTHLSDASDRVPLQREQLAGVCRLYIFIEGSPSMSQLQ